MALELIFLNKILIYAAIIAGIVNVCLLSGLVYFYLNSYKQLKSKFTFGLLYFTLILLIQNILVIVGLILFTIFGIEIEEFSGTIIYSLMFLVNLGQLIAYSILFKITWE
ncbi:MAG: hypothetical protein LLF83_07610 [Methanobacterium sp.]|nr:hypothetical protein [Methanobacterium sp.]